MKKKVRHLYIGERDILEWTQNEGKDILYPRFLYGATEIIKKGKKKVNVLRVESSVREIQKAFDFFIVEEYIEETLDNILEWAIEKEEYEICIDVENLRKLNEKNNKF